MNLGERLRKSTYLSIPYNRFDLQNIENYLSGMAAKGWIVKKLGRLCRFEPCEPQNILFRIDPLVADYDIEDPEENIFECCLFEEKGWNFVGKYLGIFGVFYKNDEEHVLEKGDYVEQRTIAEHKHYDYIDGKVVVHELNHLKNKSMILFLGLTILVILFVIVALTKSHFETYWFYRSDSCLNAIFLEFIAFLHLLRWNREKRDIFLLSSMYNRRDYSTIQKKSFKKGHSLKRQMVEGVASSIFIIFVCILLFMCEKSGELKDRKTLLQGIRLANIEEEEMDMLYDGEYSKSRPSFWVPVQIEIVERGESQKTLYLPTLKIEYYETRFKDVAREYFMHFIEVNDLSKYTWECLCEDGSFYREEDHEYQYEDLNLYSIYCPWINDSKATQYILGYSNNKVIYIEYLGRGEINELIRYVKRCFR